MFAGNVVLAGRAEELVKLVLEGDRQRHPAVRGQRFRKSQLVRAFGWVRSRTTSRSDFPCRDRTGGGPPTISNPKATPDDCARCVLTTMRFIPSYPNRPRATNASTRRTGGTSVMSNVFPEDLAPLKVRCSDSNCEEGLHCYRADGKDGAREDRRPLPRMRDQARGLGSRSRTRLCLMPRSHSTCMRTEFIRHHFWHI